MMPIKFCEKKKKKKKKKRKHSMFDVEIYSRNGKLPFKEWLKGLDSLPRLKIRARIDRIIEYGNFGDCQFVGEGVYELRVDLGPGYRVYFGYKNNKVVILLMGGDKKSQSRDIKKAKEYLKDYFKED